MTALRNIGIITSGGDAGGLNGVIRGAAGMCRHRGIGAYIIPNGYAGLYNLVDMDYLVRLDAERVDRIDSTRAGSEAGHSRVKISRIKDPGKYDRIVRGLARHEIDGLVISGGDDTGSVVVDLVDNGIRCVHAPKTMDLDLQTYSVGGDSAVNRIAQMVQDAKTTGATHNRIMITEVFGRYAGHTALRGGLAADADCILLPEVPADMDVVYAHAKERWYGRIRGSDVRAGTYTIVVAEGLRDASGAVMTDTAAGVDAFGHGKLAGAGRYVRQSLERRIAADPDTETYMRETGQYVAGIYETPEVRELTPSHLVRSGPSTAYDVNFGKQVGAGAVALLLAGITGVTAAGGDAGEVRYLPTAAAIEQCHVAPETVAFHEALGVCFGREPAAVELRPRQVTTLEQRYL
ncbi:MAG: 6-phosphofructokinase [Spirochaetaceae bacterium]|nr:6-phosphofructokinase [Spirochaetaceae bacterium]